MPDRSAGGALMFARDASQQHPWDAFLQTTSGELPADGYADELERFIGLCRSRGVKSILELGSGTGRVSRRLLQAGFHVRCIDEHEKSLRLLADRLTVAQRARASIEATTFADLDIAPRSIEAMVAVRSINHGALEDVLPRFHQVTSGLREKGLLFLYITSDQDFRKHLGRSLCSRTTVPTDGPEKGIPHVFPSASDLDDWLPHLRFIYRNQYEIRVPRNSPYFEAYSVRSRLQMRLRRMVSSHHTVLAEKISQHNTYTEG